MLRLDCPGSGRSCPEVKNTKVGYERHPYRAALAGHAPAATLHQYRMPTTNKLKSNHKPFFWGGGGRRTHSATPPSLPGIKIRLSPALNLLPPRCLGCELTELPALVTPLAPALEMQHGQTKPHMLQLQPII